MKRWILTTRLRLPLLPPSPRTARPRWTATVYNYAPFESYATQGQFYRFVIQAGGTVVANLSNNITNTNTTANAGGVSSTIIALSLRTLSNQSIGGSVQKDEPASTEPVDTVIFGSMTGSAPP